MIDPQTKNVIYWNKKLQIPENHENEAMKITNFGVKRFWSLLKLCNLNSSSKI